jgi:hypothetical protein
MGTPERSSPLRIYPSPLAFIGKAAPRTGPLVIETPARWPLRMGALVSAKGMSEFCQKNAMDRQNLLFGVPTTSIRHLIQAIRDMNQARVQRLREDCRRDGPAQCFGPHRFVYSRFQESEMRNPWIKKNPFLSIWLSGANSVAGSVRGQATAAARRATADFWTEALKPPKAKKRKPRR